MILPIACRCVAVYEQSCTSRLKRDPGALLCVVSLVYAWAQTGQIKPTGARIPDTPETKSLHQCSFGPHCDLVRRASKTLLRRSTRVRAFSRGKKCGGPGDGDSLACPAFSLLSLFRLLPGSFISSIFIAHASHRRLHIFLWIDTALLLYDSPSPAVSVSSRTAIRPQPTLQSREPTSIVRRGLTIRKPQILDPLARFPVHGLETTDDLSYQLTFA